MERKKTPRNCPSRAEKGRKREKEGDDALFPVAKVILARVLEPLQPLLFQHKKGDGQGQGPDEKAEQDDNESERYILHNHSHSPQPVRPRR
ncbi:MAG TPA: hypothetical protein H9933_01585 [Candidatus Alistipes merdavium]|nr:hypothetical protein [Candidatus Alistipes merdavium]